MAREVRRSGLFGRLTTNSRSIVLLLVFVLVGAALVSATSMSDQTTEDYNRWRLLGAGVKDRPWVSDLKVTTGSHTFVAWANTNDSEHSHPAELHQSTGRLTAAVYASSMCASELNETNCLATPDRLSIVVGVSNGSFIESNLTAINCTDIELARESIIDLTINLGTFGRFLSWAWINGELGYWKHNGTHIRIKLHPVFLHDIDFSIHNTTGCTKMPITDCNVTQATGLSLAAHMYLNVEAAQGHNLTGVVFATHGAVHGHLITEFPHGKTNPILHYQMAGAHERSDGTNHTGDMHILLPFDATQVLYPKYKNKNPERFFHVKRSHLGTPGERGTTVFSEWSAATQGTKGVSILISGISFSTPTHQVSPGCRSAPLPVSIGFVTLLWILAHLSR